MSYTWLADVLRGAGVTVVEHTGWRTHDRPGDWSPRYGVVHATAAPRSQSDDVQVRVVRDGRSDLPGPIANAVIDRQGRWHVVSGGRCNSTLAGTAGPFEGLGNTYALSTEACNDNISEPWPAVQYQSYVRGWAAWCRRLGWTPAKLVGHKEHTPGRKTDPTFNMNTFRADVARVLSGEDDVSAEEVFDYKIRNDYTDEDVDFRTFIRSFNNSLARLEVSSREALKTGQAALAAAQGVDDEGIKALIKTTAEAEAARDAEVRELIVAGQNGSVEAAEVVRRIGELLAQPPTGEA